MGQYEANYSFGTVSSITAEALGEPGQRTFRVLLKAGAASACLWLEKEQLQQLAVYIQQVGEALSQKELGEVKEGPEELGAEGITELEFKVGKLALGHDAAANSFLFLAHDIESAEDAPAELGFWVTPEMAQGLSKEALEICAAGRPRCFLCGQPINPEGHMCVRSNGHQSFQS